MLSTIFQPRKPLLILWRTFIFGISDLQYIFVSQVTKLRSETNSTFVRHFIWKKRLPLLLEVVSGWTYKRITFKDFILELIINKKVLFPLGLTISFCFVWTIVTVKQASKKYIKGSKPKSKANSYRQQGVSKAS